MKKIDQTGTKHFVGEAGEREHGALGAIADALVEAQAAMVLNPLIDDEPDLSQTMDEFSKKTSES